MIVPVEPMGWPEGREVDVTLRSPVEEDLFGDSPESIARWLAAFDAMEFPTLTEAEWKDWQSRRNQRGH